MNEERERRALELFETLRLLPREQRAQRLRDETDGDAELAAAVEKLLSLDEVHDSFLMRPVLPPGGLKEVFADAGGSQTDSHSPSQGTHPDRIGPYRILEVVGEGGMGVVYRAQQDHPSRVVALKVLRPGFGRVREQRHFEHEARALARLAHPGIARIFQTGTADFGRGEAPFLVMEFVEGRDLLTYSQEERCDERAKVSLLARTARAVHHAHQRGVIHRDLKPKNVLVTASGEPKVVDFGLAQLEDTDLTLASRASGAGRLLGTLAYMSPEQLDSRGEIDTRTDVYGLGATLYELLGGAPAFDLRGLEFPAALARLVKEGPTPLRTLAPDIDRDLAAVVDEAMRSERAERYASADAFADDLERWLRGEPVVARPVGAATRMWKAAKRSPWLTLAGSVAVVAVLAGASATTWQAHRAQRALALSEEQVDHLNAMHGFLDRALRSAGDPRVDGEELRATHVLDVAANEIEAAFPDQPRTRARLSATIGMALFHQGRFATARDLLERALDGMLADLGPAEPETLAVQHDLGLVMIALVEPARAEQLLQAAVDGRRARFGEDNPDTQASVEWLGLLMLQRGETKAAERVFSRLVEVRRRTLGAQASQTLAAQQHLAQAWRQQGLFAQAESELKNVLAELRRTPPAEPFTLFETLNTLGALMIDRGEFEEASRHLSEALEGYTQMRGPAHPDTRVLQENLRVAELQRGKAPKDAIPVKEERSSRLGYAIAINAANQAFYRGELDRAETDLWSAIRGLESMGGQANYAAQGKLCVASLLAARAELASGARNSLENAEADSHRITCLDHAIALQEEVIEQHRQAGTLNGVVALVARAGRADSLRKRGELSESLAEFEQVIPALAESAGEDALYTLSARCGLAAVLADMGRLPESLAHAQAVLDLAQRNWADPNPYTEIFRVRRAVTLSLLEQHEEAEQELLCAYERLAGLHGANGHFPQRAARALAELFDDWGQPEVASRWRDRSFLLGAPLEAVSPAPKRSAATPREAVLLK